MSQTFIGSREHVRFVCACKRPYCQFCDGGLFACIVCGGFEGTLTTDCPGEQMTAEQEARVYDKEDLDYRAAKGWCSPDGTGKSMGDARLYREANHE